MRHSISNIKKAAAVLAMMVLMTGVCFSVEAVGLEGIGAEAGTMYETETGHEVDHEPERETEETLQSEVSDEKEDRFSESGISAENMEKISETDTHTEQMTEIKMFESNMSEQESEYQQEAAADAGAVKGLPLLLDENGPVEIVAKRRDGTDFPSGYKIWLVSAEDAVKEKPEEADAIKAVLKKEWEDVIPEKITYFLPYFIEITDENGIAVKEDIKIELYINEKEFSENVSDSRNICYLGCHKADLPLKILENTEISLESDSGSVKITANISENGWFSIVQAETTDELAETDPEEIQEFGTESGETKQDETEPCGTESGEVESCETEPCEMESSETESEEEYKEELADNIVGLFAQQRSISLGTKLPTGSYSAVTSGMKASAKYNGIIFRKGISGMEMFGTASAKLIKGDMGAALYWQPADGNQKNICGAFYKKVLYNNENHQWYDVKVTLNTYTGSVTASDGKKYTCYPYVGFYKERFAFSFYRAGLYVVKCEIINSSTQKKEAVKFRLNITDIDDYQVCGFKLGNGSIDKRYCMADSVVNLNMNATIAGVSGFEQLTGSDGTIDGTDHRGDVIFDANSSEFYLGIGYGDNDKKSWSRVIKPRYDQAVAGTLSGGFGYLGLLAKSTILPIEIPKPEKQVSNDGSGWSNANRLSSVSGTYWYRIEQFVPQETADNYYSKFVFTDRLPNGADYVGNVSVIRTEDGKNVSGWFDLSAAGDVVTAVAKSETLANDSFYGYHYILRFKVKMDISEIEPSYKDITVTYEVKNTASVTAKHKTDSGDTTQNSPAVTTTASAVRPEIPAPEKRLDASRTAVEKVLDSQSDTITFTVWQGFPSCIEDLRPNGMMLTDILEDCLEYVAFAAYSTTDFKNYTDITKTFTAGVEKQTLNIKRKTAFSPDNVTIRFDIKCKIKKGYDLSEYQKKLGDGRWYIITNSAKVNVSYGYGNPAETEKTTNDVVVKLEAPIPEGTLKLTKEIDTEDIVFAHGNPVFIFKAEGTDIKGKEHTYFQAVEFTAESISAGEKVRLTAVMKVKAGKYTVTEERTMRYMLDTIHSVTNGTVSGDHVVFDVSDGETGSAVFYNKKITDADQSHTALVRNHFG
ncbi:MAG: isopeptide-forming domain-containing fimbrial protein [Eubacteriales bacterium]|nr:isopeptide-forming domain-containing fimbrial protein [Eubacteriales bacterium]